MRADNPAFPLGVGRQRLDLLHGAACDAMETMMHVATSRADVTSRVRA